MLATFSLYECAVTVDIRALTVQYIDAALQIIFSSVLVLPLGPCLSVLGFAKLCQILF